MFWSNGRYASPAWRVLGFPPHRAYVSRSVLLGLLALLEDILARTAEAGGASGEVIAAVTAVAAGAILTMVADTMIPEAFERTHLYVGLIATLGFALAFSLQRI